VLLCIGSANRDETVFAAPDRFDPDRTGPPHLAFGGGLHTCLGMFLASLEAEAALVAVGELPAGRLAPLPGSPPRWSRRSMLLRALDALPVATVPA
jgi:cytochrome P450